MFERFVTVEKPPVGNCYTMEEFNELNHKNKNKNKNGKGDLERLNILQRLDIVVVILISPGTLHYSTTCNF